MDDYINYLDVYNDQDDNNAELAKIMKIYGRGYEMYYVDEEGNVGITYLNPMESFMIYDESILMRPRYFVRIYKDTEESATAPYRTRPQYSTLTLTEAYTSGRMRKKYTASMEFRQLSI